MHIIIGITPATNEQFVFICYAAAAVVGSNDRQQRTDFAFPHKIQYKVNANDIPVNFN